MPDVDPYAKSLALWMPRLIAVWRAARNKGRPGSGPADRLQHHELKEVASGIKQLSHGLTRERELVGARYMDDPKLLGAYLLFYWPVSYAQGRQVFGELSARPRSVLDLGSGPGPLAFAALDAGAAEVTAADRSRPALDLALKLAAEAGEALKTRAWDPLKSNDLPEGEFDVISMGHVLNELYGTGEEAIQKRAELCERILARVKKNGSLLIIEPALRDTSRALLQLRDLLVQRQYAVRAPCMWRGNCPALERGSDWCHAERDWQMPAVVEDLARAAQLHKESLKMSYLLLAPKSEAWRELPKGRLFRVVSEPLEGKGRQRFMACGPEGRTGIALQQKHETKANKAFFFLKRGDVLRLDETEPRGDGLALNEKSTVKVIAPAGKPLPEPWEDG